MWDTDLPERDPGRKKEAIIRVEGGDEVWARELRLPELEGWESEKLIGAYLSRTESWEWRAARMKGRGNLQAFLWVPLSWGVGCVLLPFQLWLPRARTCAPCGSRSSGASFAGFRHRFFPRMAPRLRQH